MSEAAPTLSRCQKMKTLSAKMKKPTAKNVMCNPYNTRWPVVDGSCQKSILEKLKKYWSCPVTAPRDPSIVIGLQNVTRSLERDVIQLIVVDRSAPLQLHRHLIQLSAVRGCTAVAVDSLATSLCAALNVSRLCVLGFKKDLTSVNDSGTKLHNIVDDIVSMSPPIHLPWLEFQRPLMAVKENGAADLSNQSQGVKEDKLQRVNADRSQGVNVDRSQAVNNDRSQGIKEDKSQGVNVDRSQGVKVSCELEKAKEEQMEITCCDEVPSIVKNTITTVDYSHLYIFKSDSLKRSGMPSNVNFISLPASDDDDDDDNVVLPLRPDRSIISAAPHRLSKSDRKRAIVEEASGEKYVKLNVGKLQSNEKKKKKKRKKGGASGEGRG